MLGNENDQSQTTEKSDGAITPPPVVADASAVASEPAEPAAEQTTQGEFPSNTALVNPGIAWLVAVVDEQFWMSACADGLPCAVASHAFRSSRRMQPGSTRTWSTPP